MSSVAFFLLAGLGIGALYALLGQGLVVAFKGSGVINFAHGAVAMYCTFQYTELRTYGRIQLPWVNFLPSPLHVPVRIAVVHHPLGFVPSAVGTLLTGVLLGSALHFLVFRPLRTRAPLGKVVGSVGVLLYFQAVALLNFGETARQLQPTLPGGSWRNFLGLGRNFPREDLYAAMVAIVVGAAVWAFYRWTRFGIATRASAGNEKGAILLGYSPDRLAGVNWVIAALLAGLAGLLVGPVAGAVNPVNYTLFIVPALGAALLGGLRSLWKTTFGGLALGAFESLVVYLVGLSWFPTWLRSGATDSVPLLVIVAVLFARGQALPMRGIVIEPSLPPVPHPRRVGLWALVGGSAALVVGAILSGPWELALTTSLIAAVLMLSYVVVTGFVGQISLVQLPLAGAGAFILLRLLGSGAVHGSGEVTVSGLGLPMIVAVPGAMVFAVIVGVVVGLPALRIRGVQLAVVTIAAGLALEDLYFNNGSLSGLANGSSGGVPQPKLFGLNLSVQGAKGLSDRFTFTVFVVVVLVLCAVIVANLRRSGTGRRFLAVRANERAAAAAGVNVAHTKLLAFGLAAALAGLSGCLLAFQQQTISDANFTTLSGLSILAFAYIGGITSISGAVVGGMLTTAGLTATFLVYNFPHVTNYVVLLGGLGLVVTAILNPAGIAPSLQPQLRAMALTAVRARRREWLIFAIRYGPTVALGLLLSWILWVRHARYSLWMLLLGVILALVARLILVGAMRKLVSRRAVVEPDGRSDFRQGEEEAATAIEAELAVKP